MVSRMMRMMQIAGNVAMNLFRTLSFMLCLGAALGTATHSANAQGTRSAMYRSSSLRANPVGWHRGYGYPGGYGSGFGAYGAYPYRSVYYGPNYAFNYGSPYYSPNGLNSAYAYGSYNSYYRPWYTYPMGYYRYGYYSYPTYRMYGYPYSYNGFYPFSYYSGYYPSNVGAAPIMSTPIVNASVSSPVVAAPFVYGGFYTYPAYSGGMYNYGNCW